MAPGRPALTFHVNFFYFVALFTQTNNAMAKGQDKRKETKKAPTKTLKEKRAEKKAKKGNG
jgi:hypothetical protein